MIAAKLIDNIWATRKIDTLNGLKFMLAQEIGDTKNSKKLIVADIIGAGIGDKVIIVTGSAARKILNNDSIPIDAAIIGIIDEDCTFG